MNPAPTTTTFGPPVETGSDGERVVERAQHEHAVRKCPVDHSREQARRRTRRDDEAVEPEAVAPCELDAAGAHVERHCPRAELEVEVEVVVPGGPEQDPVGFELAGEHLLRERRPVVREVLLGADEHDPAVVALAPQRLGGAEPGQ